MTGDSLGALGLACALLLPISAAAQSRATNGVKVGEGRMHVYFDLESRADSAASLEPPAGSRPGSQERLFVRILSPELVMHLRPGFELDVPGSETAIQMGGFFDYVWHTGLMSPHSYYASRPEGALDLDLRFNQGKAVEFQIIDKFTRSADLPVPAIASGALSAFNEVTAALPIRPGGRALEIIPSGTFGLDFYMPILAPNVSCPATSIDCTPGFYSSMYAQAGLNGKWHFFPKTAALLEARYKYQWYPYIHPQEPSIPAKLLTIQGGLTGLIGSKIGVTVKGGWAHNYDNPQTGPVGQIELAYLASETASVRFGYLHALEPIAIYKTYTDDRVYLDASTQLFGGRLRLAGGAAFDYIFYSDPRREDVNFSLNLGPEYQITPWLRGGVGYELTTRASNWRPGLVALNYTRHEGYLRIQVSY